ncbi:MAG: hypothetical protein QNL54_01855 [Rhodobacterales bacterium]
MKFSEYYARTKARKLTQIEAASLLGMSERSFRRYRSCWIKSTAPLICFSPPLGICFAIACHAMDGAYDGEPTSDVLVARFGSTIEVTIPPPKNAVLSPNAAQDPTVRDRHIADISVRGRIGWQRASGYNQRSRAETLMSRWKTVIGLKLKARSFKNQKTEAKIGVRILNRMTELGRPNFERTA